jgi:hypothetical protein
MPKRKRAPSETLMIRLARVAGTVAGTVAAKTAKVIARTEASPQKGSTKSSDSSAASLKQVSPRRKKKAKRAGQKRKSNRSRTA